MRETVNYNDNNKIINKICYNVSHFSIDKFGPCMLRTKSYLSISCPICKFKIGKMRTNAQPFKVDMIVNVCKGKFIYRQSCVQGCNLGKVQLKCTYSISLQQSLAPRNSDRSIILLSWVVCPCDNASLAVMVTVEESSNSSQLSSRTNK